MCQTTLGNASNATEAGVGSGGLDDVFTLLPPKQLSWSQRDAETGPRPSLPPTLQDREFPLEPAVRRLAARTEWRLLPRPGAARWRRQCSSRICEVISSLTCYGQQGDFVRVLPPS